MEVILDFLKWLCLNRLTKGQNKQVNNMKKRAIFGVGVASLAVGLLSASGAFASSLDYAMSVGQVEMGDTVNYVIEATSDGGYIAGGQTIQCFKIMNGGGALYDRYESGGGWIRNRVEGEVVPMADCEEYYSMYGGPKSAGNELKSYRKKVDSPAPVAIKAADRDDDGMGLNFYDYCEFPYRGENDEKSAKNVGYRSNGVLSAITATAPTMRLAELDPDADYYTYTCVDYAAKFKQDGTKEWLTTIRNGDIPVAVGETASDYRLLTNRGMLYTFAKTNGDEGLTASTGVPSAEDAIINPNGTTVVVSEGDIVLLGSNGAVTKELEEVDTDTEWSNYLARSSYSKPLVRTSDGFIIVKEEEKKTGVDDDGHDVWEYGASIVKVSTDLGTTTPLLTFDEDDLEILDGPIEVLTADNDGNYALLAPIYDEDSDQTVYFVVSVDKDGNAIAGTTLEELVGDAESSSQDQEMPLFVDNFTLVDTNGQKLVRLTTELTEIDNYPLADGEMIYDAVSLTDGSLAAVGRSSTSTDNYTVDGNMNGTYLRLTAKTSGGTANPQTGDDINAALIGGVVVAIVLSGSAIIVGKRR